MSDTFEKDAAIREANRKLIERHFEVPYGSDEYWALYDPEAKWEQPFFNKGKVEYIFPHDDGTEPPPLPEGFEIPEFTPEWHWGETKIYATEDPDYFFAENSGYGKQLIGDGTLQSYENYYFHTFRLKDGKIIEYREITNPLNLMKTMKVKFDPMPQPDDTIGELIDLYLKEKEQQ